MPGVAEGMTAADDALVEATLRGDLRAFEQLMARHRDVVLRVAARIAGDDDAEDIAQDAFLRAYHRLARWRREAPFRTWLLRIVHNSALDHVTRRRPAQVALDEAAETIPDRRPTPAEALEAAERRRRLDRKLKGLSPAHRTVLVLRDVEGLSYEEIAQVTETPLGSVKARLHRARNEFIDLLRRNTYDW